MSIFVCSKCKCLENTALCNYWSDLIDKNKPLCSDCDSRNKNKKWHGRFPKQKFDKKKHKIVDGFVEYL